MVEASNFPALIQELHSELRGVERWKSRAQEVVKRRLKSPHEFLDWAKRDRHFSFTLAEVMREVYTRPSELAGRLLVAILEQLREEQQTAEALAE